MITKIIEANSNTNTNNTNTSSNCQLSSCSSNKILTRIDSVMKEINRLNNIMTIDDQFNCLYIKEVLKDSISSESEKINEIEGEQQESMGQNENEDDLQNEELDEEMEQPITRRKQEKPSYKTIFKNSLKNQPQKDKIDSYQSTLKPKKKPKVQINSQRIRTKTEERLKKSQNSGVKVRPSLKSPYGFSSSNNSNKPMTIEIMKKKQSKNNKNSHKNKNSSRGINTSSHSQESMIGNAKKTLKRPASSKWINVKKPVVNPVVMDKSQRGIKLNKMNLNKYKQTVKKIESTNINNRDTNSLDPKLHLNLKESKTSMQQLLDKYHSQQLYQLQTTKYLTIIKQLTPTIVFKELQHNFNLNSDLLKALMIFISQFSQKVTKQLNDAFTKSNMKFDTLVKNSLKIAFNLPLIVYKKNELSTGKVEEFMRCMEEVEEMREQSVLKYSLMATKEYVNFLRKTGLVEISEKEEVFDRGDAGQMEYFSQRNYGDTGLQKLQSPRRSEGKKCQTERKHVATQESLLYHIGGQNQKKKKQNKSAAINLKQFPNQSSNQAQIKAHKVKHSYDVLPKTQIL